MTHEMPQNSMRQFTTIYDNFLPSAFGRPLLDVADTTKSGVPRSSRQSGSKMRILFSVVVGFGLKEQALE